MKRIALLILTLITVSLCWGQEISKTAIQQFESIEKKEESRFQNEFEEVRDKPTGSFGLISGYNHSRLTKTLDARHKGGFFVGAFLEAKGDNNFGMLVDLMYTQRGVRLKDEGTFLGPNDQGKITLNYVVLDLLYKYHVDYFYLQGGLQGGLLVKTEKVINGVGESMWKDTKPYAVDFVVGCGYNVTKNFFIDIRAYLGLDSIPRDEEIERYNQMLSFGVGLRF